MSLVLLVVYVVMHVAPADAGGGGLLRVVAALMFVGAVGVFRLWRRPIFWFAVALLPAFQVATAWWRTDDHIFLLVYWFLGLGLALTQKDCTRSLATVATLLLGGVFFLATLTKLISPEYVTGDFFSYMYLVDPRFSRFTYAAGLADKMDLLRNTSAVEDLGVNNLIVLTLQGYQQVGVLAQPFTWLVVGTEAALATIFLWPAESKPLHWARDVGIVLFVLGTYALAPVVLFGLILSVLGIAQARTRFGQIACLMLVPLLVLYGVVLAATGIGELSIAVP